MRRILTATMAIALTGCGPSPTEPLPLAPPPTPAPITISVDASGCDFTVTSAEPLTEPATGSIALNGIVRWGVQIVRTPHYELVPSSGQLQYVVIYRGTQYSKITECRYVAPYPFARK